MNSDLMSFSGVETASKEGNPPFQFDNFISIVDICFDWYPVTAGVSALVSMWAGKEPVGRGRTVECTA